MKRAWHHLTIRNKADALQCFRQFKQSAPIAGALDTESTGLHIMADKPFVFQFGWLDSNGVDGWTYLIDIERAPLLAASVIQNWYYFARTLQFYLGHNITFDLHMMTNITLPYTVENMYDTMHFIRYAHDAVSVQNGGPPLALKAYAAQYITRDAKQHDSAIQRARSEIAARFNMQLREKLKVLGAPPNQTEYRSYTAGYLSGLCKDCIAEPEYVLDTAAYQLWLEWFRELPLWLQTNKSIWLQSDDVPYNKVDRDLLYRYAHLDIVYTLETFLLCEPIVRARGNWWAVELEHRLILPLYEMERVGFGCDKEYLLNSKARVRSYIIQQREQLANITGRVFGISQHQVTLDTLNEMGAALDNTRDSALSKKLSDLIRNNELPDLQQTIKLVQELRTLEKWYSTYIMRFIRELSQHDMLFTTINSVGTVSGRVTSNFQQFPKEAINTQTGEELFHPRRIILVPEGYKGMCYLDFSQIELRFQALYTILVGTPDLNLCRAYMPYECVDKDGIKFDYHNPTHILKWQEDWYLCEDLITKWTPTDVHGATAKLAFGLTPEDAGWKHARGEAKTVNFAKNYGAQYGKIREMFPEYSDERCHQIDDAYYRAFPGVKAYHSYCYDRAQDFSFTANLFGVRYYNVNGHKLINMLVQGSAAFYLKLKIRELYDYAKAHHLKSPWQMQIHDELSWAHHSDDDFKIFYEFKRIMEDWPDTLIPIIAEMEYTTTTWADKRSI